MYAKEGFQFVLMPVMFTDSVYREDKNLSSGVFRKIQFYRYRKKMSNFNGNTKIFSNDSCYEDSEEEYFDGSDDTDVENPYEKNQMKKIE